MIDLFISYTHADTAWAEWIGYALEEEGFSVVIQAWDFRPGKNFVMEMQEAASKAKRTLIVLSPDYLQSQFASPEWAAAFGQDSQGRDMKLVPVMVRTCQPTGLLTSIVQIRIAGMDEAAAHRALIAGIDQKRAKPETPPAFPGTAAQPKLKAFRGSSQPSPRTAAKVASSDLIPSLKRAPTDADKRRFARQGFETIARVREDALGLTAWVVSIRLPIDDQAQFSRQGRPGSADQHRAGRP